MRLLLAVPLIAIFLATCQAKIMQSNVDIDDRGLIPLTDSFGYANGGRIIITIKDISIFVKKNVHDPANERKYNLDNFGFFLSPVEADANLELDLAENRCLLNSIHSLFTFKDSAVQSVIKNEADHVTFNLTVDTGGAYFLYFANCETDTPVSFACHIEMFNIDAQGHRDYLSVGDTELSTVFWIMFALFASATAFWFWYVWTNKAHANKIHYLMGALGAFKALTMISQAMMYHYIERTGYADGWNVAYYIFTFFRGILFFVVVVLVGTGWSYMKPFLGDREKRILLVVIPLQGTHRGSETLSTDGEVKGYAEFDDSSREGGLFGKAFDDSLHVPYLPELTFDDEPLTDPLAGLETACQPADDAQAEIALIIHHFKESQKGTRLVNMDHLALTLLGFGYMAQVRNSHRDHLFSVLPYSSLETLHSNSNSNLNGSPPPPTSHQFITCIGRQVGTDEPTYFPIPIIIEPHFRLQFCLNHSTPQYNRLMQATPIAFVGTQGQLSALVRILAAEIVQILSPGAIKGLLPSHAPYPNSAMTTGGATSTWLLIYPRIISMWLPAELNKLEDTLSFLAFSEPLPNTNLTCTMHTAPALTVPDMSHPLLRWSSSQLYQEPCERIDLQECTMHMAPAPTVSDMSHSLLRWPSSQLYQEPYERIDLQECTMHTASALTVHDRSHSLLRWASSQLYQEPYERIEPQELSCISDELCNSERADARIDELLDTGRFDGRSSDPNGVLKTLLESMKCIAMEHLDGIPDMLPPDFHCVPEKQENKRGWLSKLQRSLLRPRSRRASAVA